MERKVAHVSDMTNGMQLVHVLLHKDFKTIAASEDTRTEIKDRLRKLNADGNTLMAAGLFESIATNRFPAKQQAALVALGLLLGENYEVWHLPLNQIHGKQLARLVGKTVDNFKPGADKGKGLERKKMMQEAVSLLMPYVPYDDSLPEQFVEKCERIDLVVDKAAITPQAIAEKQRTHKILNLIRNDPRITAIVIISALGVGASATLHKLKKEGLLPESMDLGSIEIPSSESVGAAFRRVGGMLSREPGDVEKRRDTVLKYILTTDYPLHVIARLLGISETVVGEIHKEGFLARKFPLERLRTPGSKRKSINSAGTVFDAKDRD